MTQNESTFDNQDPKYGSNKYQSNNAVLIYMTPQKINSNHEKILKIPLDTHSAFANNIQFRSEK